MNATLARLAPPLLIAAFSMNCHQDDPDHNDHHSDLDAGPRVFFDSGLHPVLEISGEIGLVPETILAEAELGLRIAFPAGLTDEELLAPSMDLLEQSIAYSQLYPVTDASFPKSYTLYENISFPRDGHILAVLDLDDSDSVTAGDLYGFAKVAEEDFRTIGDFYATISDLGIVLEGTVPSSP